MKQGVAAKNTGLHQLLKNCITPTESRRGRHNWKRQQWLVGQGGGGKKGTKWWLDIRGNDKVPSRFFTHRRVLNKRHRIRHIDQERMSGMVAMWLLRMGFLEIIKRWPQGQCGMWGQRSIKYESVMLLRAISNPTCISLGSMDYHNIQKINTFNCKNIQRSNKMTFPLHSLFPLSFQLCSLPLSSPSTHFYAFNYVSLVGCSSPSDMQCYGLNCISTKVPV